MYDPGLAARLDDIMSGMVEMEVKFENEMPHCLFIY